MNLIRLCVKKIWMMQKVYTKTHTHWLTDWLTKHAAIRSFLTDDLIKGDNNKLQIYEVKKKERGSIKKRKKKNKRCIRYNINVQLEGTYTLKPSYHLTVERCAIQACLYGKFYCHHSEVICCDTSDKQNKQRSYIALLHYWSTGRAITIVAVVSSP